VALFFDPDLWSVQMRFPPATRLRPRYAAIAVAALSVVAALSSPAVGVKTSASYPLSNTLRLQTIRLERGPQEIRVLKLRAGAVPDLATADSHFPLRKRTSAISSGAGALAGINGDFGTNDGLPVHMLMIDGELWTTGIMNGNAIAWSADGNTAYLGTPDLHIQAQTKTHRLFRVKTWNGPQDDAAVSGYTARGGTVVIPPGLASPTSTDPHWCEARLAPLSGLSWASPKETAITRRYQVVDQPDPCPQTSLSVGSTTGAVVVAERFTSGIANKVRSLAVGDRFQIRWKLKGWPGTQDVMGAGDVLVDKGVNVAPGWHSGAPHIYDENPRTAIGITQGCPDQDPLTVCEMRWMTIDGRQTSTNWSAGVRMPFLANQLIKQGSWDAINLDGGGSTTMWVSAINAAYCQIYPVVPGCLVNRPASTATGQERPIRQAAIVLPGADPGTPPGLG
jgi:phosphodiester glycosidase